MLQSASLSPILREINFAANEVLFSEKVRWFFVLLAACFNPMIDFLRLQTSLFTELPSFAKLVGCSK